jgi:hypothetical protein
MPSNQAALPELGSPPAPGPIRKWPVLLRLDQIRVDRSVYPREEIDPKRVARYAAVLRDGVEFEPMEVEAHPTEPEAYRVLDGAHRHAAYRDVGSEAVSCIQVDLAGHDPLLYSASRQIGPTELKEKDACEVAQRAYQADPGIDLSTVARAVGRSVQQVYVYTKDLREALNLERDLATLRLILLGLTNERIAHRLGYADESAARKAGKGVETYFGNFQGLENFRNTESAEATLSPDLDDTRRIGRRILQARIDLDRGVPVSNVAGKLGWPEPLLWAVALEGKSDAERFEALKWGIRTWDHWGFNDVDARFGDDWAGRIPAQLVAHALYFFTKQGDLIFDPMAGGGVVPDTCLAVNRRCWAFDLADRPEARPEIEPHRWKLGEMAWPVNGKSKPDLIFFDPPYFTKKAAEYAEGSISELTRADYLEFFREFFALAKANVKSSARLAFLNADWRDFQGKAATEENPANAITIFDYARLIEGAGWQITHVVDCPMSTERFTGNIVKAMQGNRTLGVVRRTLLMARRAT